MQDDNYNTNEDLTKTALTVTRTEVQTTETDSLEDEMKSDIMQVAFEGFMADPTILGYVKKAKPFIPMVVKQVNKFFGKDKVRIMIYIDEETGAFVFEKVHTEKVNLDWYKEAPDEKDFLIIQKEDLDNPAELIQMMTQKMGISLF